MMQYETEWKGQGACRDRNDDTFYPDQGATLPLITRQLCGACPVKVTCLEYALTRNERFGIWGGVSSKRRRELRRGRPRATCPACESNRVVTRGRVQFCGACALSWRLHKFSDTTILAV